MPSNPIEHINIRKINAGEAIELSDQVVVEEPLEIQLEYSSSTGRMLKNIAVTMRTPGNDEELAAGFLFTEGVISDAKAIKQIKRSAVDENMMLVTLQENVVPMLANAAWNFYSTSSCGICGKASIDAIRTSSPFSSAKEDIAINSSLLYRLQESIKDQQLIFEHTGGIHACALFDLEGKLISIKEDVGRHNALDKLVGAALLEDKLPLQQHILFLSGRAGFELVQKAVMAGIRIIAAVGAPSSLAVELAKEAGTTLIGFLRDGRFNLYSGEQRINIG